MEPPLWLPFWKGNPFLPIGHSQDFLSRALLWTLFWHWSPRHHMLLFESVYAYDTFKYSPDYLLLFLGQGIIASQGHNYSWTQLFESWPLKGIVSQTNRLFRQNLRSLYVRRERVERSCLVASNFFLWCRAHHGVCQRTTQQKLRSFSSLGYRWWWEWSELDILGQVKKAGAGK